MKNKFILNIDIIKSKKKIFAHINKKPSVIITESDVRRELRRGKINAGDLKTQTENLFIFDLITRELEIDDITMTDLTESYGASELPVFELEEEDKPPVRRTNTRKPRTRRKTNTPKK